MGRDSEGWAEVKILFAEDVRRLDRRIRLLHQEMDESEQDRAEMASELTETRQLCDRLRNQVAVGAATLETVADMIRAVHLENKRLKAENERLRAAAGDQ